jgi:hypothetical protein
MQKRSLLDKFKNNRISKFIRNGFSIKPAFIDTSKINSSAMISDSFIWRTHGNFSTMFKFSDILRLFLNKKHSSADVYFYNHENNLIKKININELKISNSIKIDQNFLNGYSGFGYFHMFFKNQFIKEMEKTVFSNRCYLGFSYKNKLPSFVHGNVYAFSKDFELKNDNYNFVNTSFFKNQKYIIQNSFIDFDYSELFFTNPTNKKINFTINNVEYSLKKFTSKIIKIENTNVVEIISNCYWLRPIIFNYKNDFIDVYHS